MSPWPLSTWEMVLVIAGLVLISAVSRSVFFISERELSLIHI